MDVGPPNSERVNVELNRPESAVLLDAPADDTSDLATKAEVVNFSVIVPLYNVAVYLPEFLKSLEAQKPGRYVTEFIFVDDGSPDNSAAIVQAWLTTTRLTGKVLRQENGGVSSARNLGVEHATGEWFTFPDSDDMLKPAYFASVARFLLSARGKQSHIVATNVLRYFDDIGEVRDSHALRFKFKGKQKNVNLIRSPHYIHLMVNSGFIRARHFSKFGLRFKPGLAVSEDAELIARLLLNFEEPILGIVPTAEYLYRKRSSKDSALDSVPMNPEVFISRWREGYLPLFESAAETSRGVPEWLANVALYDMKWVFEAEVKMGQKNSMLTEKQRADFLSLIGSILRHISDDAILGFRVTRMSLEVKYVLLALKGTFVHRGKIYITDLDQEKQLVQVKYYFSGPRPSEHFHVRAKSVFPIASKVRRLDYFDQSALFERIVWLPANSWLSVDLDGVRQELVLGGPRNPSYALTERDIWTHFDRSRPLPPKILGAVGAPPAESIGVYRRMRRFARQMIDAGSKLRSSYAALKKRQSASKWQKATRRLRCGAQTPRSVRLYGDAWVFVDRLDQAQDNAEHLYKHVAREHPDVNIWFAIQRSSADWPRLKRDGFKLVDYRSRAHIKLMLNASHVISSHVDFDHVRPIDLRYYSHKPRWRFTFLQHGVIKDDLSIWLNRKPIKLFVTSTRAEHDSIAADGSSYAFTSKEVALTGLPRHDSLLLKRRRIDEAGARRLLLIAPTWRNSLLAPRVRWDAPRDLVDGFDDTDYALSWFGLLRSARLREIAEENSLQIAFLPHPGLQPHIGEADVPDHVSLLLYAKNDVQEVIASSSILITDYSSLAFEAAYLDTSVLYFHFEDRVRLAQEHVYTEGYFDYELDGFGPIVRTLDHVVDAVSELTKFGGVSQEPYVGRAQATFEYRDGLCSERVYGAIMKLDKPSPPV